MRVPVFRTDLIVLDVTSDSSVDIGDVTSGSEHDLDSLLTDPPSRTLSPLDLEGYSGLPFDPAANSSEPVEYPSADLAISPNSPGGSVRSTLFTS